MVSRRFHTVELLYVVFGRLDHRVQGTKKAPPVWPGSAPTAIYYCFRLYPNFNNTTSRRLPFHLCSIALLIIDTMAFCLSSSANSFLSNGIQPSFFLAFVNTASRYRRLPHISLPFLQSQETLLRFPRIESAS